MIGVGQTTHARFFIKRALPKPPYVDPNKILETDVLRWLFLKGDELMGIVQLN